MFVRAAASIDPMLSTVGLTIASLRYQRALETEYFARQNVGLLGDSPIYYFGGSVGYTSFNDDNALPATLESSRTHAASKHNTSS